MTDDALRALLTEFDELTISLTGAGLTAHVDGVELATAATIGELLSLLDTRDAIAKMAEDSQGPPPRRARRHLAVVKAAPDLDLYGEWSRRSDSFALIGTRADMARVGHPEAALARADRYGTSAREFAPIQEEDLPYREGSWSAAGFSVDHQFGPIAYGWLPREQLGAYLEATRAGDHARAAECLTPG